MIQTISKRKRALYTLLSLCVIVGLPSNANAREMTEYPRVKLQSLDKITAHTMTFEADVGSTLKFGPLYMKVQSCQKSSPIDDPESAAFIQVWEGGTEGTAKWVFSGWMFASSPGLSPMDHPIYDVWVIDCLAKKEEGEEIEDATNTDTENNDDKSTPKPSPETGDMLE